MSRWTSQPGFAALALALAALLQLAGLRWLAGADEERVYLAGHAVGAECSFRRQFGAPCPTCGMTRSVILTLDGQWRLAWRLNPAGPFFVTGLVAMSLALLALACLRQQRRVAVANRTARWIKCLSIGYGGFTIAVLIAHWLKELSMLLF